MARSGRRKPTSWRDWRNGTSDSIRCGRCSAPSGRALLALNVPHFVSPSDGSEIGDAYGASVRTQAISGLARARERLQNFDDKEIAWQIEVIRQNANSVLPAAETQTANNAARGDDAGWRRRGAGQGGFHRRSRPDRRGAFAPCHSPRTGRRLDRARLARRLRGFSAGVSRPRSLQRLGRHRGLSCRACGSDRVPTFRRTGAGRRRAAAQEPGKPQRAAHGARARHRRRHRPGLDRLCARRDGEVPR